MCGILYHNIPNSLYLATIWGVLANLEFFGHGKGEVDGARVLLKREITKKHIKP